MYKRYIPLVVSILLVSGCGEEELPENANGRELFEFHCASCHEKDGSGDFIKGIPANSKSIMSASEVMTLIRHGKANKPGMPVLDHISHKEALLISNYLKEQLRN